MQWWVSRSVQRPRPEEKRIQEMGREERCGKRVEGEIIAIHAMLRVPLHYVFMKDSFSTHSHSRPKHVCMCVKGGGRGLGYGGGGGGRMLLAKFLVPVANL